MSTAIKYIAVVKGAREVTLVGTADFGYWRDRLKSQGLYPCPTHDGRAQLLISAVDSKWLGVRFRELSVSVFVCQREDAASPDGVFLIGAFNSSWFFARCERTMFHTPYRHGQIDIQIDPHAAFRLIDGPQAVLHAERSTEAAAAHEIDVVWDVKIFLPTPPAPKLTAGRFFYAQLSGVAETYPILESDTLRLTHSPRFSEIACLIDSHFTGTEWHVRRNATHARSKTFARDSR